MYKPNWYVAVVVVNEFSAAQAAQCADRNGRNTLMSLSKECETIFSRGYGPSEVSQDLYDAILRMYNKANEIDPRLVNRVIAALNN